MALAEELYLPTTPGLEPALLAECHRLGLSSQPTEGGVTVRGPPGLHQDACLWLRTASRVLLRVAHLRFADEKALERNLATVSLAPYRDGGRGVEVAASSRRSKLRAQRLEEVARRAWRLPPEPGEAPLRLQLRAEGDTCTVAVDCGGELLYRRGYRQEISHAPLRETLGAGLLLLAGYQGDGFLWDVMCGSGTLLIEGALMALRRAPGRDRTFAFKAFPSFDAARWEAALARARTGERDQAPAPILGSDLNAGALGVARRNARRAGVGEHLTLERLDATALKARPALGPGLLVANLPYGKRVGDEAGLLHLYRALGQTLRTQFSGSRVALFYPQVMALETALALPSAATFNLDNGGIACRLAVSDLPHAAHP